MNKKLSEWTIDEMESLYMQLGSFRKCAEAVGTTHPTWIRYYNIKKNEKLISDGNKYFESVDVSKSTITNVPKTDLDTAIQTIQNAGWFVTKKPVQPLS